MDYVVNGAHNRLPPLQHRSVVRALVPQVIPVDKTMGRIHTPMVVVVLFLSLDIFHRISTSQSLSIGRLERIEIGATRVMPVAILCEKSAVYSDYGFVFFWV
jgi:hypothetical protein